MSKQHPSNHPEHHSNLCMTECKLCFYFQTLYVNYLMVSLVEHSLLQHYNIFATFIITLVCGILLKYFPMQLCYPCSLKSNRCMRSSCLLPINNLAALQGTQCTSQMEISVWWERRLLSLPRVPLLPALITISLPRRPPSSLRSGNREI